MTLLVAAHASDGIAAVSDRKESLPDGSSNEVAKYHLDAEAGLYLSLAGDGMMARLALGRLAAAGAGTDGAAEKMQDLAAYLHEHCQVLGRIDGILITSGPLGQKMHDVYIRGGDAEVCASGDEVSIHGDRMAMVVCYHLARGLGMAGLPCDSAAAHLHVLASSVAEMVESVGERARFGLDMGAFPEGRRPSVQRLSDELGRLEIRLHGGLEGPGTGGGPRG